MDDLYFTDADPLWPCRAHPWLASPGVCPLCLRDRLLLLCSDCASLRPCSCSCSRAASTSDSISIGAVGRVSDLIHEEPEFRRSRSAAVRRILEEKKGMGWIWPFKGRKKEAEAEARMCRSRSVAAGTGPEASGGELRWRRLKEYFPSPMKAFGSRSKRAGLVQQSSPMCRG